MVEKIFVGVVCLLLLKYTIELAGRTGSRRRSVPMPLGTRLATTRQRSTRLPRHWGKVLTLGVTVATAGWVSDKAAAPFVLAAGIALIQTGVFFAGVRWARRPRRRAQRQPAEERSADRTASGAAVATRTA